MKTLPLALLLVASTAAAATHTVSSANKKCTIAVPKTWKGTTSVSTSPDKKVSVMVSMPVKSMNGKPNVYRAIAFGNKQFCLAEVVYESGTVDDARTIAHSLAGVK
jgi:hypothetical protein